jgi:hypothetical protein
VQPNRVLLFSDHDLRGWSGPEKAGVSANDIPPGYYKVIPPGKHFLFFSLFSVMGKVNVPLPFESQSTLTRHVGSCQASSFIGPFISSAISDAAKERSANAPFYFLFALGVVRCAPPFST